MHFISRICFSLQSLCSRSNNNSQRVAAATTVFIFKSNDECGTAEVEKPVASYVALCVWPLHNSECVNV